MPIKVDHPVYSSSLGIIKYNGFPAYLLSNPKFLERLVKLLAYDRNPTSPELLTAMVSTMLSLAGADMWCKMTRFHIVSFLNIIFFFF